MKKNLIINTRSFSSTAEYIEKVKVLDPAIEWDSVNNWADLCRVLGVDAEKLTKGKFRRAIDKAADLAEETPAVPAPAEKEEKKTKLPRKSVVQKAEVDPELKAEMEKHLEKMQEAETVPAKPVIIETPKTETQNVDEVAALFAQALSKLKVQSEPAKADLSGVSEILADVKKLEDLSLATSKAVSSINTRLNEIEKNPGKTIHVKIGDLPKVKVEGLVHEQFENIVKHAAIRDHVLLVGPAGSGKTTTCEQAAQVLGLDFYCKSVCSQTSKAELLGYCDANGNYVTTDFRSAYENGGLFVLGEIDAGNPNVIAVLNSALANGVCSFADGMVKKNENFVLIACANTFGMGADRMYVGRNQLDAATLDRFSVIDFGYDEKLEIALSGNETFAKCIQEMRKEMKSERVVISPRATIQGAKLLAAGFNHKYVFDVRVSKGMPDALKQRCLVVYKKYFKY